ncbi:MAG: DUF4397 domain-containing protein [Deltaproteobacteria bacterium]|nr:DUF4397 domain-containing protein [Deltaproteobacteria bacterium]
MRAIVVSQIGEVFLDDEPDALFALDSREASLYTEVSAGLHSFHVVPDLNPDRGVGPFEFELEPDQKYTLVVYTVDPDSDDILELLLVPDDDQGIAPDQARLHVIHVSEAMGWWPNGLEFDLLNIADPPTMLVDDLGYLESAYVDVPAGLLVIGLDPHDDMIPHWIRELPDLPGGSLVNIYTSDGPAYGGDPAVLVHFADATVHDLGPTWPYGQCGDGKIQLSESCEGEDFAGATCVSLGFVGGDLECDDDCEIDYSGCFD